MWSGLASGLGGDPSVVWFEDFENDPLVLRDVMARVDRIAVDVGRDPATFVEIVRQVAEVKG